VLPESPFIFCLLLSSSFRLNLWIWTNKFLSFCFSFVAIEGPEAGSSAMSESEAEEIGHSMTINDELRLCGMAGDDEDDVIGDAEALLGPRAPLCCYL
jgi:hypothetical protein